MNKKILIFLAAIFLLLSLTISFTAGFAIGGITSKNQFLSPKVSKADDVAMGIARIREVYSRLDEGYVEKGLSRQKITDGAIDGMLAALGDPYTRYLKKTGYESFNEQTNGRFGGVGIELGVRKKQLTVIKPMKNTPAERAGIEAGDTIIKIDSTSTKNMSIDKAVKLIRGPEGTSVTLTLGRKDKDFSRELKREQIKMPNVSSKIVDKDIGYIMVHAFNKETAVDVRAELDDLKKKDIKGAIVDLRNNPGGLLNEAIDVSSIFIKSGPIVKVKDRTGKTDTFSANDGADDKIPLVVLVNHASASASEIFAGAVQDSKRGVIVGERTYGKASVQTVVPLANGNALIMTTAKYFTPKGRSLNKHGVDPDIVVKLKKADWGKLATDKDPQLIKAKKVVRDIIAGKKIGKKN